jgi:hypothetical protein
MGTEDFRPLSLELLGKLAERPAGDYHELPAIAFMILQ